MIVLLGMSHHKTPVGMLEKFCVNRTRLEEFDSLARAIPVIDEFAVLSTCNRVELYAVTESIDEAEKALFELFEKFSGVKESELLGGAYFKSEDDAVRHVFDVAAGLDSMALGETEILGQVKDSYLRAQKASHTGKILNTLFQKALNVGKKARTDTDIGRGKVSVSSIAVDLARKIYSDLSSKSLMLIGSGEVARLALESLRSTGIKKILVTNRSPQKAIELTKEFGGDAVAFEDVDIKVREADILISSVGSGAAIISAERVRGWTKGRGDRPLFMIDLGIPRNIDELASDLDGVYLYNLDDLKTIAEANFSERKKAVLDCEAIISSGVKSFRSKVSNEQFSEELSQQRR